MRVQAQQTFRNIQASLAAVGGEMDDVVSIVTYVTTPDGLRDIHNFQGHPDEKQIGPRLSWPLCLYSIYHPRLPELTNCMVRQAVQHLQCLRSGEYLVRQSRTECQAYPDS